MTTPVPLNVLLVEDQPADSELILAELRRAGFEPVWRRVETEPDFAARLGPELDLILADYALPQFDALRGLRLLRARNLDTPFIVITASQGEEAAVECLQQGAADYLLKDRLARLGPAVTHALREKQLRDAQRRTDDIQAVLFQIAQIAALTSGLEELLRIIHQQLGRLMDTSNFYVALYDEVSDRYQFPYVVDEVEAADTFTPMELRQSLTDYVRRTGKAILVDEEAHRKLIERGEAEMVGAFSPIWLGAPLKTARAVIGVVVLQSYTERSTYSEKDLDVLAFVSDHLALAIERQRALEAERKQLALARTLQGVGSLLTTQMRLDEVYERLFDMLAGVVAYESVSVQLLDEDGRLFLAAGRGFPDIAQARHYARQLTPEVIEGRWGRRRVMVITNTQEDPEWRSDSGDQPIGSWIGAALVATGKFIGVLNVDSHTPQAYDEAAGETVVAFANQAAAAIENARLFQAEREQRELAEALRQISNVLATGLDFNSVLDHLLEQIARVAPYDSANLMLIEAGRAHTARLRGYEQFGPEVADFVRGLSFVVAATPNQRWMAETGQPLVISDTAADPGWVKLPTIGHIRSWAGAPIMVEGRAIAFFSLDKTEVNFYRREHVERLSAFAGQAALALENARLFTETQRREIELATLLDVARAVSSSLDLDEVLRLVATSMVRVLGVRRCALSAYDADGGGLRTLAVFMASGETDIRAVGRVYRLIDFPLTKEVIESGRAVVVRADDPRAEPGELATLLEQGDAALLLAPLRAAGRTVGLAELFTADRQRLFTLGDLRMAQALADQAGVAIQNARLFAGTAEALFREERLGEISRAISGALDLPTILKTVIRLAARLTGAEAGCVLLADPAAESLWFAQVFNLPRELEQLRMPPGTGLTWQILATRQPILLADYGAHPQAVPALVSAGVRAFLGVPLLAGDSSLGSLALFSLVSNKYFTQRDLALAESVGRQAGVVIQNARLFMAAQDELAERKRTEQILHRQLQELLVLHSAATAGAQASDLDELIESVTETISESLYPHNAGLLLVDEAAGLMRVHPSYRVRIPFIGFSVPMESGVVGRSVRSGRPERIPDVSLDPDYAQIDPETRSEMCVPLKVGDRVIGALNVESARLDAFSEADERLLMTVAGQLATAIEKLRLFAAAQVELSERRLAEARAERRAGELAALSHLGQTVASSLELAAVLEKVIHEVQALLGAEGVSVLLLENPDELVFSAVGGSGTPGLLGRRVPVGTTVAGEVVRSGRSLLAADSAGGPRIYRDIEKVSGFHTQSLLAVPLRLENEIIGVMEAVHSRPDSFGLDQLRLLEAGATWAAIAIGNARRHESTRRLLLESEALADIGRALNETLDLGLILQLIVDAAQRVIPSVDRAVIHLLDEDEWSLRPAAVAGLESGLPPVDLDSDPENRLRPGVGVAGQAMVEGRVINVGDIQTDPRYLPLGRANEMHSLLAAPVTSGARRLGTISVLSAAAGVFSADDERVLGTLGSQAALAIENARYFEIERRRAEEAEAVQHVTQTLISRLKLPEMLAEVVEALAHVTNCQHVSIYLLEGGRLELASHHGPARPAPDSLGLEQGIVGRAARSGQQLLVRDVMLNRYFAETARGSQSAIAVPLVRAGNTMGVVLVRADTGPALNTSDLSWLSDVGRQLSVAIDNVRLYADLERALQQEKSARAQLVQGEKLAAMGRLVASVAHELNNPLQAIQNALYLVRQDGTLDEQSRDDVQVALSEADRMAGLIGRLRESYRPAADEHFEPSGLDIILAEVHKLIATHLRQNNVTFSLEIEKGVPPVLGIHDQLKQVFLNLCLNAVEAMPGGGKLAVGIRHCREDARVLVSVADNGVGIAPEALANLFDPFYTTKEGGTGLGLPITYDIIRRHQGQIEVESGPERGATFKVWLPVWRNDDGFRPGA